MFRAVSSFFDRLFQQNVSFDNSISVEGAEGALVRSETDGRSLLQITLNEIDSHSIESIVNFAYTGLLDIDTDALKKTIDDLKAMNKRSMIDILESRLNEVVSYTNCISNLIIAHSLGKDEIYRKISVFILDECYRCIRKTNVGASKDNWENCIKAHLSCHEISSTVQRELEKEVEQSNLAEDKSLLNILNKLFRNHSLSKDEETKLIATLVAKKREKCGIHDKQDHPFDSVSCYTWSGRQQCRHANLPVSAPTS